MNEELQDRLFDAIHPPYHLDLSSRYLSLLPNEVLSLSGLSRLDVSCNSLEVLPNMDKLPSLTELDLSFNKLSSLPIELAALKLTSLKASYNKLTSLPPALFSDPLGLIGSLEVLHLNDNELERIPPTLGHCLNLRDLRLNYNKLQNLPLSLSQLSKIESVDLEGNLLRPTELMSLGGDAFSLSRFIELLALSCPPPPPPSLPLPSLGKSGGSFSIPKTSQRDASSADVLVLDDAQEAAVGPERFEAEEETSAHLQDATWGDLNENHLKPRSNGQDDKDGAYQEEQESERSANDAALEEVASLPPAAAAVMYRTFEAVRGGAREVKEGRPLSRGGGSLALPPSSAGRPGSSRPGTALGTFSSTLTRSGLSSSSSQHRSVGPGASSTSRGASPGGGGAAERSVPTESNASALSFPLASGLRSMMRRQSKKVDIPVIPPQENRDDTSLDLVRQMLQNRNPELLEAFENSIAEMSMEEMTDG